MTSKLSKLASLFLPDLLSFLALLAMVLWFDQEMVWQGKLPFFRDLATYHYPNRFILAENFQAGRIPLWSRQIALGFPFAANPPAAVFYPFHALFLLLPMFTALRLLFIFHYLVAATGSYALCRGWGSPRYLALTGAALFAFSGQLVSLENMLDYFQTAVWLPWVLYCGERWFRSRARWAGLYLIALLLIQFLAGHPETYLFSAGLLFLDGLRIQMGERLISLREFCARFLAANALVAGLAMFQLLPSAELFFHSARFETLPYAKAVTWSLRPLSLINFFFLDKQVDPQNFSGLRLVFSQEPSLILTLYMGLVALCGVLFWAFAGTVKERLWLLGLWVFFALLALGGHTPLYGLVSGFLPLGHHFRYPEKFLFPLFALLLYGIVRGLCWFHQSGPAQSLRPLRLLMLAWIGGAAFYLYWRLNSDGLARFIAGSKGIALSDPAVGESLSLFMVSVERQLVVLLGLLLLLFLWKRQKLRPRLFEWLFVILTFFDLASANRPYHFALSEGVIGQAAPIIAPAPENPSRIFYILRLPDLHPNSYAFTKRPFGEMVSALYANLIPNSGVFSGFDYMQALDSLRPVPYDLFLKLGADLPPERLYRLLGALNVRYINSFASLPEGALKLVRHLPDYPAWLYRLDRVVPRAYLVGKVVVEKDGLRTLQALSGDGFDPSREVILEQPPGQLGKEVFRGETKIVSYEDRRAMLWASLKEAGVLVLADSYYPGWRVYIDGVEGKILRANLFFRAVPLPAGDHVVEFRYEPRSFVIGLAISAATLGGLAAAGLILRFRRQRVP